jgi:hypothetical protein
VPAENPTKPHSEIEHEAKITTAQIFDDPESRRNLVGLFDLLLKIDQRLKAQDKTKDVESEKAPKP